VRISAPKGQIALGPYQPSFRKGGGLVDTPGRRAVGAKGEYPHCRPYLRTGFDDDWFARARAGTLRLPDDGRDYVSLVHIADMAEATAIAITRWPSRRTLIVADDEPATWRDVFQYIAAVVGAAPPQPRGRLGFPSCRVSDRRAREALGGTPVHPSYRAGLVR
jgi:nucleoside-diphosphate-sugar epimerase